jgi:dephospho-CoA kinase
VVELLGPEVLAPDGSLDRPAVAEKVFASEEKREKLEGIIHPEVFRLLGEEVSRHRGTGTVVVFDAPLIMETGFDEACDLVVVVTAPLEERLERAGRQRGLTEADARARINAQIPEADRVERADVVIENAGDLAALEERVDEVWRDLHARAAVGT